MQMTLTMNEKLILTENECIWLVKNKDQITLYEDSQKDDNPAIYPLWREDKLKIIKFLLDTI